MPLVPDFFAGRTPPDLYHQYLMPAFEPWAEMMIAHLKPRGNVLDIACGTGLLSRLAAQEDTVDKVEAIDVAEPMIAKAQELNGDVGGNLGGKIHYQAASALELPFPDDTFDTAFCHQGLQFFPDKRRALEEAKRVLKPGARAVFNTWTSTQDNNPQFAAFEDVIASELGEDLRPLGPFSFGDPDAIRRLAEGVGLEVLSLEKASLPSKLPDARTFVLFDIGFVGRPAADGQLQPVLDFSDPAADAVIERIIERVAEKTREFRCEDGSIIAPMTAHTLVVQA